MVFLYDAFTGNEDAKKGQNVNVQKEQAIKCFVKALDTVVNTPNNQPLNKELVAAVKQVEAAIIVPVKERPLSYSNP